MLGLVLGACVSKPTMKLKHAMVSGVKLGFPPTVSVVMTMTVDVNNPNSYDVAIRGVRGTLVLQDRYTLPIQFQPQNPEGIWLPSDQTTPVAIPVPIPVDLALTLSSCTITVEE